jgi:hypothetical protein
MDELNKFTFHIFHYHDWTISEAYKCGARNFKMAAHPCEYGGQWRSMQGPNLYLTYLQDGASAMYKFLSVYGKSPTR